MYFYAIILPWNGKGGNFVKKGIRSLSHPTKKIKIFLENSQLLPIMISSGQGKGVGYRPK